MLDKKALREELKKFTGISCPYEEPLNPEVALNTDKESPNVSGARILQGLEEYGYLSTRSGTPPVLE